MKTCTKCGETKPLNEFHRHKHTRDGRQSWCKACQRAAVREYDRRRRAERAADPGPRRCWRCERTLPAQAFPPTGARCRACHAEYQTERNHGLPKNARAAMLTRQGGCCWLCGRALLPGTNQNDAAHPCVLGYGTAARLVCRGCILALRLAPSADTLERAGEFLERGNLGVVYTGQPYDYPAMDALFRRLGSECGWICPLCEQPMDPEAENGPGQAVLEHDHRTDMVRAVTCWGCNLVIGFAADDPETCYALAAYKRSQEAANA